MTFDEILDQAIKMLQRRKQLSYRALKRQFDLDDEYLEDLKEELLYSHPVIDDGRGLIWAGESGIQPEPSSYSSVLPVATEQNQPTQAESSSPEPLPPDAERRQLTVMFCDLADSTKLSGQLDPEDLRDVIRAYQSTSAEIIERFDGYVAQHLGDGLMVYFGWPRAHEDDAQRAVHAGLGILAAMQGLNSRLEQEKDIRLAVRIGIHTGLVVVGEIGQGASQEHLALGETPNVASRIEGVAAPDMVVISRTTYQLIQGYFVCEELGLHTLKGVDEPQQVHRVLRESDDQSRLDVATTRGLTPLVGRESETTLLLERWEQAKEGQGQVVLLSGEAGIGKSRLLQILRDHVSNESHIRLECRSSPYYQNTALYPITDMFQRVLNWHQNDTPKAKLGKLEQTIHQYRVGLDETMPLLANLLSLTIPKDRYPPLNISPQQQRQRTLAMIVTMLLQQTEEQPVLFILEDLHWTDPSTLELLGLLIDQVPTASFCALMTCRPEFQPPWGLRTHISSIALNRLNRTEIERLAVQTAGGKRLPEPILEQIAEKTDGVPLFVEEMTKAVLESGTLKDVNGQYEPTGPFSSLTIPVTLQDSLMSRLDRLVTAKAVAQYAAVIGRQFSYKLLHAVSQLNERTLQDELRRLIEAELLYQRGLPPQATYIFKHALIQDAAYQSLLKTTRRQYHQRIAQVLEAQFPETAELEPELLAHHYTEAGQNEAAIDYWQRAGESALGRSAHAEAIGHLTKGLAVLTTLPDTPERSRQELLLQTTLGPALMASRGYAALEVEQTYARARALCQQMEEAPQFFSVLRGVWYFYLIRVELQTARELGEQLLSLAQRGHDPALLLEAHHVLGNTLNYLGAFAAAQAHLEQGIALYNRQQHRTHALLYGQDPGVGCCSYAAVTLWMLGFPDQALQRSHEALTLAQEAKHPLSLTYAMWFAAFLHFCRREVSLVRACAESVITLAAEQGFVHWWALGTVQQGWACAMQGQRGEGLALIRQGLADWQATGARAGGPYLQAMLAETYGKGGQAEEGLGVLTEALTLVNAGGERRHEAELYRLKGVLLLMLAVPDMFQVETCFQRAISVSRSQQAKSWELRAATSLARLWQSQGKCQEAYDLLAPVYGWFTEGFDTADLQEAKALLDELA